MCLVAVISVDVHFSKAVVFHIFNGKRNESESKIDLPSHTHSLHSCVVDVRLSIGWKWKLKKAEIIAVSPSVAMLFLDDFSFFLSFSLWFRLNHLYLFSPLYFGFHAKKYTNNFKMVETTTSIVMMTYFIFHLILSINWMHAQLSDSFKMKQEKINYTNVLVYKYIHLCNDFDPISMLSISHSSVWLPKNEYNSIICRFKFFFFFSWRWMEFHCFKKVFIISHEKEKTMCSIDQ